jgi:hypothetical protein
MDAQPRTAAVLVAVGPLLFVLGLAPGMPKLLVTFGMIVVMLGIIVALVWLAGRS